MSDNDEVAYGVELAAKEAKKLHAKKPYHELLRLFAQADNDEVWEEFQERFGKKGISKEVRSSYPAQAYFWGQYFLALKKAVEEADAPEPNKANNSASEGFHHEVTIPPGQASPL